MLRTLSLCLVLIFGCASAQAEKWPERPVHLIVPYAAGGGTDTVARVLAQKLSGVFGQQFVVENRTGASGMIGATAVAKSDPDGYTLLVASPAEVALNPNLFKNMAYDPAKDLAPITLLAWTPLVLAAHPSLAASTFEELLALARKQEVNFSSPGIGSSHHLTGEYINALQHTKLVHVPYRGATPAITDAVSGQVKLTISGMPPVVPFLQSGALKAIAVTSKKRSPLFPDIPAMAEFKVSRILTSPIGSVSWPAPALRRISWTGCRRPPQRPLGMRRCRRFLRARRLYRWATRPPNSATSSVRKRRNTPGSSRLRILS
jgi:tripartite-type tricarboxylate transporter receptor subunit TctC